jgi:hypothetical protein
LFADDVSTEPGGIFFEELAHAPVDWLEELLCELKKMPKGCRHLKAAWTITNSDDYPGSA